MSPAGSQNAPEARARQRIDQALTEAGWTLQDRDDMNLAGSPSIAVREFKLDRGHGYVDYMLFADGHPVGVCEAKPAGTALIGVEHQVKKYVEGIPSALAAPYKPLPFAYLSTGEETLFINHFDPHARTRPVFSFQRIGLEIDRQTSTEAALRRELSAQQRRLGRLRQAVLTWAFKGRLVDQDPADEPADALLARVRAERAAAATGSAKQPRARKLKVAS